MPFGSAEIRAAVGQIFIEARRIIGIESLSRVVAAGANACATAVEDYALSDPSATLQDLLTIAQTRATMLYTTEGAPVSDDTRQGAQMIAEYIDQAIRTGNWGHETTK